jgi:hypothetical protein
MANIDDLRKLGWSEELISTVKQISSKISEGAITAPLIDGKGAIVYNSQYDSSSIVLNGVPSSGVTISRLI